MQQFFVDFSVFASDGQNVHASQKEFLQEKKLGVWLHLYAFRINGCYIVAPPLDVRHMTSTFVKHEAC